MTIRAWPVHYRKIKNKKTYISIRYMGKNNFAFDKTNYMLIAAGMAVVIIGFILMSGSGSTEEAFNPDIFSVRRIKVAPAVCFFGFCFIVYGIMHKAKVQPGTNEDEGTSEKDI